MSSHWDIAAYDRKKQLMLAVEVKNKLGASPGWATRLRHNILAHGTYSFPPYFLLALPDRFYLWKESYISGELNEPTYSIDARPLLKPYFDQVGVEFGKLSGESFELLVAAWLGEIIYANESPEKIEESKKWLVESGLYQAIAGGSIAYEVST